MLVSTHRPNIFENFFQSKAIGMNRTPHKDEKRANSGRRRTDRRSGADTRSEEDKRSMGERRSNRDRRTGQDRRTKSAPKAS
jgi:hypothetical protein